MTDKPLAIYPGSFDPFTLGHLDLVRRGLAVFDRLVVAIVNNPQKTSLFTPEERAEMIREALNYDPRVEVESFDGLLIQYVKMKEARVILRGLRAVSDFEYEFQMAQMNRHLEPGIETFFMMTGQNFFYLNSRLVKEVARMGGSVKGLVPDTVLARLNAKFGLTA
jgi:pantetheine-phosphate adenylyltransferase